MPETGATIIASPSSIEESCFSVPAVRALHYANPDSPIVVMAPETFAPLWERVAEVTEVISYPASASPRKLVKLLGQYAQSIAWEESAAAIAFAKAGIPKRLGPPAAKLEKWLTHTITIQQKVGPIEHRVQHYLLFAEKMGAQAFEAVNFQPPPRPTLPEQTRIALAPGSDFGPSAEWPLERFTELATHLGGELLIFPSSDHATPATKLANALGDRATLVSQEMGESLDLLASCHFLIGNDGSLPHLAAHVGTKSIVLFGPNEPAWKRPLGKTHHVIRHHVACSPCLLDKCPLDHRCMSEITVAEVLAAVEC